jgi:hypothetical protein
MNMMVRVIKTYYQLSPVGISYIFAYNGICYGLLTCWPGKTRTVLYAV